MKEDVSYTFTQTPDEIQVTIHLSPDQLTSKEVKANGFNVRYRQQGKMMFVQYKGKEMLKVMLYKTVDPKRCLWTLKHDGKGTLVVLLCEKTDGLSWHGWTRLME